ncbi:hypothetical protein ACIA8E_36155 [Streptomyces sp. NPDC051664]|uniref:hypothetical protein n=1 Tax=Streptomyces sp. NPDC051664 TaxID=3365668 RepID=UPI0037A5BF1C
MFRIRRRIRLATPPDETATWAPPQHACADLVDAMPQLDSPLITELIALHAHTRNLGWLSTREAHPEEYRHLVRPILQHLLDGWRAQTGGRGGLEDLLTARPTSTCCHPEPTKTNTYGS